MLRDKINEYVSYSGTIRKDTLLITLGSEAQLLRKETVVDPYNKSSVKACYGNKIKNWGTMQINPLSFILFSSRETISLSRNCYGLISTLSHTARLGLMSQPSSFFVDPEFKGYLTLELLNMSLNSIILYEGMPIAKIIFFKCDEKREKPTRFNEKPKFYYGKSTDLESKFYSEFNKD
ncbi:MAG: hypothetical protein WAR79_14045 [Melioribacteraceae bacterium]